MKRTEKIVFCVLSLYFFISSLSWALKMYYCDEVMRGAFICLNLRTLVFYLAALSQLCRVLVEEMTRHLKPNRPATKPITADPETLHSHYKTSLRSSRDSSRISFKANNSNYLFCHIIVIIVIKMDRSKDIFNGFYWRLGFPKWNAIDFIIQTLWMNK